MRPQVFTVLITALASVACALTEAARQDIYDNGVDHVENNINKRTTPNGQTQDGESDTYPHDVKVILDVESDGDSKPALIERKKDEVHETDNYKILKAAVGRRRKLESGHWYAVLEKGKKSKKLISHHRVVVGKFVQGESHGRKVYDFTDTDYYDITLRDPEGSMPKKPVCRPRTGKWSARKVAKGTKHSWLGPVKSGVHPQAEGEAFLKETGERFKLDAWFWYRSNNCHTYAQGLYKRIEQK